MCTSHTLKRSRANRSPRDRRLLLSPALVGHEYYASVYIIRGTSNSVLIWISLDLFAGRELENARLDYLYTYT